MQTFEQPGPVERDWSQAISPIEEILEEARNGHMFILVDHEDRENEGDLVIPAQWATPDAINFMATHGRGLICLSMTSARIDQLGLPLMSTNNSSRHETAFTLSIEAREGVTTGISAADRARTVQVAIDASRGAADIATPGHVFPLRARDGGVLVRAGHTEAAVDISRLAGLNPSGVICEIMNEDGSMARLPDLVAFAQRHNLRIGTISDLISYRRRHDNLVKMRQEQTITSEFGGDWTMRIYTDETQGAEHIVLIKGDIGGPAPVLVRMHAMDPLLDVVGVGPKGRADEFGDAMRLIAAEGRGVLVLLRDLTMKLVVGDEVSPQTLRQYGLGAQILSSLGISDMILLSNSPQTQGRGSGSLWAVDHGHPQDLGAWIMAGHSDNDMGLPAFDKPVRIAIVIAPYYTAIAHAQIAAATAVLDQAGATHQVIEVPGSLEIATAIAIAHRLAEFDGYVALGCVIRGATSHYDVVVNESSRALTMLGLQGLCIGNGIITVETRDQAEERADAARLNTAGGAAAAALHLIALTRTFAKPKGGVGFQPRSESKATS